MNRTFGILFLTAGLMTCSGLTSSASAQRAVSVQTDHGAVVGQQTTANVFLGLPYAAPPVGPLRWTPPQPVSAWTSPLDASKPGDVCPQVIQAQFAVSGQTAGQVIGNEDCLSLNVYAPQTASSGSRLPVMVWIHGGAYTLGSGSDYDASTFARKHGVVVTLNYRLGALGFLALPALTGEGGGASGNYGLLDQQAALKWVQANIAAFGGDPGSVTIAGESAGGMSVCAHLASPGSAGLFRKAIIQSGLCTSPGNAVTQTEAATRNLKYVSKLGCAPDDLDCLRKVDVTTLLKTAVPGLRTVSNLVWSPVYQTPLLPLTLQDAFAQGQFNKVPVMVGTNHDEGRLFVSVAAPDGKPVSLIRYWGAAGLLAGLAKAQPVLAQYPYRTYKTPALAFATMFTDGVFSCPALMVDTALSKSVPVYAFEFNDPQAVTTQRIPVDLPGLGAYHTSSLAYVFQKPIPGIVNAYTFTPEQAILSEQVSSAWANFVKTGNPNPAGQTGWPVFDPARGNVQVFTPDAVRESTAFTTYHKCSFWKTLALK